MPHLTKVYQCDFCKAYRKKKDAILNHEKHCFHNPKVKACATCANLTCHAEDNGLPPEDPRFSQDVFEWCESAEVENDGKYHPSANKPLTKHCINWRLRQ